MKMQVDVLGPLGARGVLVRHVDSGFTEVMRLDRGLTGEPMSGQRLDVHGERDADGVFRICERTTPPRPKKPRWRFSLPSFAAPARALRGPLQASYGVQ